LNVTTPACLWLWSDGSRYLRQFSTSTSRADVLRRWKNGEGEAKFRVRATAGNRILGEAEMALPVDLIERKAETC